MPSPDRFLADIAKNAHNRDGIDRFLVLETRVGVRPGDFYAPSGFAQLYAGLLTPNPLTPYRELFEQKAFSYRSRWPWLRVQ